MHLDRFINMFDLPKEAAGQAQMMQVQIHCSEQ